MRSIHPWISKYCRQSLVPLTQSCSPFKVNLKEHVFIVIHPDVLRSYLKYPPVQASVLLPPPLWPAPDSLHHHCFTSSVLWQTRLPPSSRRPQFPPVLDFGFLSAPYWICLIVSAGLWFWPSPASLALLLFSIKSPPQSPAFQPVFPPISYYTVFSRQFVIFQVKAIISILNILIQSVVFWADRKWRITTGSGCVRTHILKSLTNWTLSTLWIRNSLQGSCSWLHHFAKLCSGFLSNLCTLLSVALDSDTRQREWIQTRHNDHGGPVTGAETAQTKALY